MGLQIHAETAPLDTAVEGVVRVRGTRIPLDTVVVAFHLGSTPEEIQQQYPTLHLVDIYSVIAYYLRHQDEVDEYLRQREIQRGIVRAENEARWPSAGIRERLLARRKHQAGLTDAPPGG